MWNESFNQFGLFNPPPTSTDVPLDIATKYNTGSIPPGNLSGVLTKRLSVGQADNTNNAAYIDYQGIYLGNANPALAPFYVDMLGNLIALSAFITGTITGSTIIGSTIETAATGQRVVINSATNEIDFYDSANNLAASIKGSLVGGNDELVVTTGSTTTTAIRLEAPTASGLARVIVSNFGGNANVTLSVTDGLGDSSAVSVLPNFLEIASTGTMRYLPNGIAVEPQVTGSRGGNAALANLLSVLAGLGLIDDNTTP